MASARPAKHCRRCDQHRITASASAAEEEKKTARAETSGANLTQGKTAEEERGVHLATHSFASADQCGVQVYWGVTDQCGGPGILGRY